VTTKRKTKNKKSQSAKNRTLLGCGKDKTVTFRIEMVVSGCLALYRLFERTVRFGIDLVYTLQ